MKNHKSPTTLLNLDPLWRKSNSPIWLSSSFHLKRNLSSFPFPPKMNETQEQQLLALLKQTLVKTPPLKNGFTFDLQKISSIEKEALDERFLLNERARYYLFDPSGFFLVQIQENDHLVFTCFDSAIRWDTKWNKLSDFESSINQIHDFAFNPKFGYLSSNPSLCGTGLIVKTILHLPCLIHLQNFQEVLDKTLGDDLTASGLGSKSEYIGDFLVLQNQFTLGVNEDHILDSVHKAGTALMQLEQERRVKLQEKQELVMIDKISRAHGLLLHSFRVETKEAFAALSLLKLGIGLKWIEGMMDQEISTLFFWCRRAHLAFRFRENLSLEQSAEKRAEYLKNECKKLELNIK